MTDRELLELAAKAANVDYIEYDALGLRRVIGFHEDLIPCETYWNPLTRDDDAFRLAVKLNIGVVSDSFNVDTLVLCEPHHHDPYAATRRAIVRAAAEIGKAMP